MTHKTKFEGFFIADNYYIDSFSVLLDSRDKPTQKVECDVKLCILNKTKYRIPNIFMVVQKPHT